jgi:uncharacterized damage-inducible protein DinB
LTAARPLRADPRPVSAAVRPATRSTYDERVSTDEELGIPAGNGDERELLLGWLDYLRAAVIRKTDGLDDQGARWTPEGGLLPLIGVVNHLTHVEWRWIEGGMHGLEVERSEGEFHPGASLTIAAALIAYRERATATNSAVRALPTLSALCQWGDGRDLRWVLLHLINETARHAGHADATRELLDGTTGE